MTWIIKNDESNDQKYTLIFLISVRKYSNPSQRVRQEKPRKRPRPPPNSDTKDMRGQTKVSVSTLTSVDTKLNMNQKFLKYPKELEIFYKIKSYFTSSTQGFSPRLRRQWKLQQFHIPEIAMFVFDSLQNVCCALQVQGTSQSVMLMMIFCSCLRQRSWSSWKCLSSWSMLVQRGRVSGLQAFSSQPRKFKDMKILEAKQYTSVNIDEVIYHQDISSIPRILLLNFRSY